MTKLPNLAGLEGLLNLDKQGVDIRPTLLRVITDQYLQAPVHTPDEERQFTELALRLLDETDIATRAAVAVRLARHACAPRSILHQLARDVLEVAEPVLRQAVGLTPEELDAIATERGPSYAEIIAARREAEAQRAAAVVAATAPPPEPQSQPQLQAEQAPMPATAPAPPAADATPPADDADAATADAGAATASASATVEAWELCELFFAAGAEERRLILTTLDYVPNTPAKPPLPMQRTEVWRLESAALQHNTEAVVRDLERSLGVSARLARRIVADELGEPVVAAAKALRLPADVLQRMLLFMNPRIGQSVDRVYELAALYDEITVEAAQRLIDIWQDADPAEAEPATHVAQWQSTVERARQALSDLARRATARQEAPSITPPRRALGNDAS